MFVPSLPSDDTRVAWKGPLERSDRRAEPPALLATRVGVLALLPMPHKRAREKRRLAQVAVHKTRVGDTLGGGGSRQCAAARRLARERAAFGRRWRCDLTPDRAELGL